METLSGVFEMCVSPQTCHQLQREFRRIKSAYSIIVKTGYPDLHYSYTCDHFFNLMKIISEFKNSSLTYTSKTN